MHLRGAQPGYVCDEQRGQRHVARPRVSCRCVPRHGRPAGRCVTDRRFVILPGTIRYNVVASWDATSTHGASLVPCSARIVRYTLIAARCLRRRQPAMHRRAPQPELLRTRWRIRRAACWCRVFRRRASGHRRLLHLRCGNLQHCLPLSLAQGFTVSSARWQYANRGLLHVCNGERTDRLRTQVTPQRSRPPRTA